MSLIVSIALIAFLYFLQKKKISFGNRVIFAMFLGVAFGAIFKKDALIIEPVGKTFVGLIKMVVMPLVISSIISSITSLDSADKLKKIGFKTIGILLGTTAVATIIGIAVGKVMDLGAGIELVKDATFKAKEIPTLTKVILDMVPSNPVASMAAGSIIPVIIFSMFIAIAIVVEGSRKPENVKAVKEFFNSFNKVMFRVTKMVIKLTPYGVFGLMSVMAAKNGIESLLPLGKVILAVYIACLIQLTVVHSGLVALVAKVSPIKFFKKIYPAQVVAFTTQSSYGTLPVTMKALTNRVKISENIASFAAPIGATIGMNACGGIYPAIVAIFVARVYNIDLTMTHYATLVATTTLASIGMAGVPGTASIAATVVLTSVGLPVEGLAMVLGIDAIIDMGRTATNVTGAAVAALITASTEGEFDRAGFNRDDVDELELGA
jgi:uncharacterized protein